MLLHMAKPGRLQPKPSGEFSRFTDRENQEVLFRQYLLSPIEPPVLMFFGVGGAGKTWLLKKLQQQVPVEVPVAFLDFDTRNGGQRFLDDPAAMIYAIRDQFGQAAPRFDLAYGMLRHKQGVLKEPAFKGVGPVGLAWELVAAVVQDLHKAVPGASVGRFVIGKLGAPLLARIKGTAFERFLANKTGNDFLLALRSQTSQEIGKGLVGYLAEDMRENLPTAMNRAVRAVLFFDTFEDVYQGLLSTEHRQFREQGIRDVAANFDFALTVIAGQNHLNWEKVDPGWANNLSQHSLGGLAELDARSFLAKCDIAETALQNAILATSRQTEDGFHCFSLGLCADIVYADRRGGSEPEPMTLQFRPEDWTALAGRFLKSLGSDTERRWIERLAMTPRFDEAAARKAFSSGHSAAQDVAWETLPDFTFVDPLAKPWFSIRAEMRRAIGNQPSAREHVAADHEWWQDYWQTRSQSRVDLFASLAWYHSYRRDPAAALEAWSDLANAAVEAVPQRMQEHFSLMSWWDPVGLLDQPVSSAQTAEACFTLAGQLMQASLGNRSANVRRVIECYRAALGVYTERDSRMDWVVTQGSLGAALLVLPTGDKAENLRQAMECFRAIEPYVGECIDPEEFAGYQGLLGLSLLDLPIGDRVKNLGQAMTCFNAALPVFAKSMTTEWALAQISLGRVWMALPTGQRADNVRHALECFNASLGAVTEHQYPRQWALTQTGLGTAWSVLPAGDPHERAENLRRALECFNAALRIFNEENFPTDWARVQAGLGGIWSAQPSGSASENLQKSIGYYHAALRYLIEQELPQDWAETQRGLGRAWFQLPAEDRAANLRQAVACYNAALRVYREAAYPQFWASVQSDLGDAWLAMPGEDRVENLRRARESYQAAQRVYTEKDDPPFWARLQNNTGIAQMELVHLGYAEELPNAIASFQAALRIYKHQDYPQEHLATTKALQNLLDPSGAASS